MRFALMTSCFTFRVTLPAILRVAAEPRGASLAHADPHREPSLDPMATMGQMDHWMTMFHGYAVLPVRQRPG